MHNTGDRKSIRQAEKAARQLDLQRLEFVQSMMSSAAGRAYAYDQLSRAHVFTTSFDRDPLMMAFREGERNLGLQLLTDILTACPDQFVQMQREANVRYHSNNRSSGDRSSSPEHPGGEGSGWDVEASDSADGDNFLS